MLTINFLYNRSGLYGGTFQKFTDDKFDRSQYTYVATKKRKKKCFAGNSDLALPFCEKRQKLTKKIIFLDQLTYIHTQY